MFLLREEYWEFISQIKETPEHLCVEEETDVVGAKIFTEELEQSSIQGGCFDEINDSDNSVQA